MLKHKTSFIAAALLGVAVLLPGFAAAAGSMTNDSKE
jgi:hypothetical protein